MKHSLNITVGLFLVILTSLLIGCSKEQASEQVSTAPAKAPKKVATKPVKHKGQAAVVDETSEPNALQVAKSIEDFSTLVTAIETAGVEDAVVNAGPLTIFAPLNTAFEKLPEGTLDSLLKPEAKSKLAFILTNHVAPANYPVKTLKKNIKKNRKLFMASGHYLDVAQENEDLIVGGTKIIKSVKVSNGWIHVIDDVLVPTEKTAG